MLRWRALYWRATKWRRQTVMLYQQLRIPATRDESAPIRHAACCGIPHNATFHRRIRFILGQWSACFMNHNSVPLTVQLVKTVKSARDSRGQSARSGPAAARDQSAGIKVETVKRRRYAVIGCRRGRAASDRSLNQNYKRFRSKALSKVATSGAFQCSHGQCRGRVLFGLFGPFVTSCQSCPPPRATVRWRELFCNLASNLRCK